MSQMFHLVRHAQASFGAADYDNLSELGHRQSAALGVALKQQGVTPDAVFIGAQKRHRQTWEGIESALQTGITPVVLPGWNEFDFGGLLKARYAERDDAPADLNSDRKTHFRILRDTVLEWQSDEISNPPETFAAFTQRVREARAIIAASGAKAPIAVSSGGAIGRTVADVMEAPAEQMILLQLQVKNCAVARFVLAKGQTWLNGFNETPHIDADNEGEMLTYS
ncbi:bifunctional RNase H/acid phosphatase [Shimia sp. SK013]|uniref:histidine phosphatase family protein n=1 Tax=Shimia sp. SK013 TaxID=1389006 RepID=UPI0006CDBDDF|nr:histidine phosphatase family protein [Shimia sp. SK013]KPA21781.1 bifunctional RNase H/acid phosphatase [Shimia sp. SK013]